MPRHTLFLATLLLAAASTFTGGAEPADWFHQAQWGIMTHYLGAAPSSKGGTPDR